MRRGRPPLLGELDREQSMVPKVLSDPQYREHLPTVRSFMARSRQLRDRPRELLELQADMASALLGVQASQRELEGQLVSQPVGDSPALDDLERAIAVCKRLAHIIKQIADGIAWRTLQYDRAAIYQLALKNPTGHLQRQSAAHEFAAAAARVGRTGDLVAMNDLTNCLRYGDYTAVAADGTVRMAEVKAGKASRRSGRATRQRRKLDEVLEFLDSGVRLTGERLTAFLLHKTRARTHLQAVGDVIRQAKAQGCAHARLSDCLAVEALYMETLFEQGRSPELHNPFAQSRQASSHHSLTFFDQFARNLAPYSVYPFPDDDCSDVMCGYLWLCTHFNRGNLIRCLRRRGLSVRLPTESEADAYNQLDPGEKRRREDDVAIRVWRPDQPTILTIAGALLGRLHYEYLDEECFADCVEEVLEQPAVGVTFFPAFENEAELWN